MKKNYIAFFDLDHTILDESSGTLFVKYSYAVKKMKLRELLLGIVVTLLHRLGLYDTYSIVKKWAMKYKGHPESEMIEFSNRWFDEIVIDHIRREAIDEIEFHKKNGGLTVLLSAASPYVCNPLSKFLSIDDVICSRLEVAEGLFTGEFSGEYCYGVEKRKRAVDYCEKNCYKLKDAYYYGDSCADIPVLEIVGNPVCITPDRKLRKHALRMNWDMRSWK